MGSVITAGDHSTAADLISRTGSGLGRGQRSSRTVLSEGREAWLERSDERREMRNDEQLPGRPTWLELIKKIDVVQREWRADRVLGVRPVLQAIETLTRGQDVPESQPRLIGNTCLYIHFCKTEKNVPICSNHCSFQLKWTLEAVKLTTFISFHTKYDLQLQSFD